MGIQINQVFKRFGSFTAVNGVSVDIEDGEFFVMLGPSGCGKTTTLRMVAGLELPSEGEIRINGKDVTYEEPRHRDIAMAFQDYGLYPHLSVYDNIAFPLKIRHVPEQDRRKKVEDTAEKLGIAEFLQRKPGQISGGQRQRIAVARALALKPDFIILDEAVSALDVLVQDQVLKLLSELQSELGLTYLFITHDLAVVRVIADLVCVMEKGRVVEQGTVDEIFANPSEEYTRRLLDAIPGASITLGGGV